MSHSSERVKALLTELVDKGHVSVSKTKGYDVSTLFYRLEQSGIIKKHRQGNGNRFSLVNHTKLSEFILQEFPQGLDTIIDESLNHRVAAVSTFSNSKSIKTLGFDILMVRGTAVVSVSSQRYLLSEFDDQVFLSLKVSDKQNISLHKPNCTIITIENPTVFVELEKLTEIKWDIAVYTAGKMSNILLNQLDTWQANGHHLIHFGDYDYVGLLEYVRVLERCPTADIFIPKALTAEIIKRYGKAELLVKQTGIHLALINKLESLPTSTQKTKLLQLHQLIQSCAKGLEQETFLIKPDLLS